jgi:hypothetical protein
MPSLVQHINILIGYLGSKNVGEMTISKDNTKDANMNDLVERIDQRRASMESVRAITMTILLVLTLNMLDRLASLWIADKKS